MKYNKSYYQFNIGLILICINYIQNKNKNDLKISIKLIC